MHDIRTGVSKGEEPIELDDPGKRHSTWAAEPVYEIVEPLHIDAWQGTGITSPARAGSRRLSDLPDFLSVAETATLLRVSRNLVWRAIAEGQIAAIHIGRRVIVPRASISRLVEEATTS